MFLSYKVESIIIHAHMGISQPLYKPQLLFLHVAHCFMMCYFSAKFPYNSKHVHVDGFHVKKAKTVIYNV